MTARVRIGETAFPPQINRGKLFSFEQSVCMHTETEITAAFELNNFHTIFLNKRIGHQLEIDTIDILT